MSKFLQILSCKVSKWNISEYLYLMLKKKINTGLVYGDPWNIKTKCVVHYIGTELAIFAHPHIRGIGGQTWKLQNVQV